MFIESVIPSNHFVLCHPLLLPSIFPSIKVFSKALILCIRWPKNWSSALTSVLPVNTQDWSPLGWTGWISLQSKGLLRVFSMSVQSVMPSKHFILCRPLLHLPSIFPSIRVFSNESTLHEVLTLFLQRFTLSSGFLFSAPCSTTELPCTPPRPMPFFYAL